MEHESCYRTLHECRQDTAGLGTAKVAMVAVSDRCSSVGLGVTDHYRRIGLISLHGFYFMDDQRPDDQSGADAAASAADDNSDYNENDCESHDFE